MKANSLFRNIREYENLHIALWLVKDACWVMTWHLAGMIMIVPTLLAAVHIAWKSRKNKSDLFHNTAVCLWISANATWMTGEFFYNDMLRPYAVVLFASGLMIVIAYYFSLFLKENRNSSMLSESGNVHRHLSGQVKRVA